MRWYGCCFIVESVYYLLKEALIVFEHESVVKLLFLLVVLDCFKP